MIQRGGAVHPRNKEYRRLELEMKYDSKRRSIMREKESGKLDACEASAMLLSEAMKHLSESINLETKMSPQLIEQTRGANLQAEADHFLEER